MPHPLFTTSLIIAPALLPLLASPAEYRAAATLAPMPLGRHMFVAAAIEGKIYCVGGNGADAEIIRAVHVYDVAKNSWVDAAPWPTPSAYPCGAAANGKLYIVGGPSGADRRVSVVECYDPASNSWRRLSDLPGPRSHSVAVAKGDSIYVLGGFGRLDESDTGPRGMDLDDVAIFNTRTERWSKGPKLPKPMHGMSAAVVNGSIHVFGGLTEQVQHWKLDGDSWIRRAELPFDVVKMAAGAVGNRAVIIGGGENQSESAIYDPAMDKWTVGPKTSVPRFLSQAVGVGESLFALGGVVTDARGRSQTKLERFDAAKMRWHQTVRD
jgi:N-acetylneuraminic acid mutarotase